MLFGSLVRVADPTIIAGSLIERSQRREREAVNQATIMLADQLVSITSTINSINSINQLSQKAQINRPSNSLINPAQESKRQTTKKNAARHPHHPSSIICPVSLFFGPPRTGPFSLQRSSAENRIRLYSNNSTMGGSARCCLSDCESPGARAVVSPSILILSARLVVVVVLIALVCASTEKSNGVE
jgi:hypothetical protein